MALILILATTMFGALLVLQVGASLIQLIAGRAAPGALLTDATRRSLGRPALDRPGWVLTTLPAAPGTGLNLPAGLPPPTPLLLFVPRLRLLLLFLTT